MFGKACILEVSEKDEIKNDKGDITMKLQKMIATVGAVAVMAGSFGIIGVMASNYADTSYTFSFATGGNVYATKLGREKQDSTSSYMKCNSYVHTASNGSGSTYYGTVHGGMSASGSYTNPVYNGNSSKRYSFTSGTTRYMTNYVHEASYTYANIYCESGYTNHTSFSGVWSPDSI